MSDTQDIIMNCIICKNKCAEYNGNFVCEKNYYEWMKKSEECYADNKKDREMHMDS